LRVCLVIDSDPGEAPAGGVEKATYALCVGLQRLGHDVVLVAGGHGNHDAWQGVPALRIPASGRHMLLGGARAWSAAVARALTQLRPDVAQGQGLGFAGAAVAGWRGGPSVVSVHGNTLMDLRHARGPLGWAVRAPLVRAQAVRALRGATAVVNVTPNWRVNCPVKPRAQVHIPNPVDEAFFTEIASPEPGSVAYFGGLRRIKGGDLLLAAWARVVAEVPDARLYMYGVPPGSIDGLPPHCIPHATLTSSESIAHAMGRASAVVLPSRYEVTPIVAAEAMTVGVPLIATDVGGVRALAGGVAEVCRIDTAEIAAQIVSAIRAPQTWTGKVAEGRKRSEMFRTEYVVGRYVTLYESILRRG